MTQRKMRIIIGSVFALSVFGFSQALLGQAVSGTLLGTVTDSTGKVVPNAQVTIVLTGQSAKYPTVTNGSGDYTEPDLPSGTYAVMVVAQGFKRETRENIALATNTTMRVDVTLSPGSATETVEVTTAPPELQTDRADISSTIEQGQIGSLPLSSGNSFQSLLNTVPGMAPIVFNNSQFYNANNDLSTNSNGQSSYVNLYQMEGIDDDQRTGIHIILVPPAAAIQNVDITTNNFEAEFGRAVGTVVNVTLKSGSNSFHGSAFQNMENNGVNARNYFAAGPNGRLVYNYTGGSLGGPVLKNKLFFFGDFLRTSDHESGTTIATIPFYNVTNGDLNLERVLRPGLRSEYRRYGRLRGWHCQQCLRNWSRAICRQPHSDDESWTQPSRVNRPAGFGHPRQKSQNKSLVGCVHCRRNDQQFFVESPVQQRCHQLRH